MAQASEARIAVVHDWLIDYAGSERVLAQILTCFPQADLFALLDHMPEAERAPLGGRRATTTFLQRMPGIPAKLKYYLPLMPIAVEQIDVTGYDLVLSSSHAVAKGVIVSPDALHISYVHSPMRYAWDQQFAYLSGEGLQHGVRGVLGRYMLHRLRAWDYRSAAGVDTFVANSRFVARRILKAYRREAQVIPPPVDTDFFRPMDGAPREGYLAVSRMMAYKRLDAVVQAFARTPEKSLTVIGDGPQLERLKAMATPNVRLLGRLGDEAVRANMQRAKAMIFAAVEDFGIVVAEALACGTPVIALARGGAAEIVAGLESQAPTGVLFETQTPDAIADAVERFEREGDRITAAACRARAEQYAPAQFRQRFASLVERELVAWRERRHAVPGADA